MGMMDPLIGMKTIVDWSQDIYSPTDIRKTLTYAPQITKTYAPQISTTYAPQTSVQHAPQIILGSPYASIGAGAMLTPQLFAMPTQEVGISPISSIPYTEAPTTHTPQMQDLPLQEGGGLTDKILGIAIIGIVAYVAYKALMRPKSKKRDVKLALK